MKNILLKFLLTLVLFVSNYTLAVSSPLKATLYCFSDDNKVIETYVVNEKKGVMTKVYNFYDGKIGPQKLQSTTVTPTLIRIHRYYEDDRVIDRKTLIIYYRQKGYQGHHRVGECQIFDGKGFYPFVKRIYQQKINELKKGNKL